MNKEPDKRERRSELWWWTEVAEKRLWHWLQLLSALAIPVVLTVAGSWFILHQGERQQAIEDQRAQDAALQAYLYQMT